MENLNISGTFNTPQILFDCNINRLSISGESRPDNIQSFFEPIFNWINVYSNYINEITAQQRKKITIVTDFKMEYFNSSTLKVFNEILLELKKIPSSNNLIELNVQWFYETDDIDMLEAGNEISDLTKVPITLIQY